MTQLTLFGVCPLKSSGLLSLFPNNFKSIYTDSIENVLSDTTKCSSILVILLDDLSDDNISQLIKKLKLTNSKIILAYGINSSETAYEAFKIGMDKFLFIDIPLNKLKEDIDHVTSIHNEDSFYPSQFVDTVINSKSNSRSKRNLINISEKESIIIKLIWGGLSNIEIANELSLSERTIERYRSELLKKSGASNMISMMREMLKIGLLTV